MNRKTDPAQGADIQGEGNYEAGRRYDEKTRDFVESGRVEEAARGAQPRSAEEAREIEQAEREGRSHAHGEDPALKRGGASQDKAGVKPDQDKAGSDKSGQSQP